MHAKAKVTKVGTLKLVEPAAPFWLLPLVEVGLVEPDPPVIVGECVNPPFDAVEIDVVVGVDVATPVCAAS